ncbi:MAG: NrtA/SsuA/CpmA family ABC transporter substrate-binding protein [Proteobacteria bacterium]|nr:NrtA/SsuA/CpmA family ABC transporter substrate-binding protein [Pseudomonadota bacterium]
MKSLLAAAALLLAASAADAQTLTKMTIATGVDPAFGQFYVAKEGGLFEKNGLDVQINTGPSGSAMVPFLVNDQVQAAYGSDLAGVINHQVDNKIVAVADGTYLAKWESVIGRNVESLEALKGKKVGVAFGTGAEIFWRRLLIARKLNPADYKLVNVEAPEMLAALERSDIDAFAVWEPWPSRALMSIKNTKVLATADGIYNNVNFVYMNRGWIEKNKATAEKFIKALCEANDMINNDRPAAAKLISKFLKMPLDLTTELMPKLEYDMDWQTRSFNAIKDSEHLLAEQKKLKAPLDYSKYVYTDLLKAVRPGNVKVTEPSK